MLLVSTKCLGINRYVDNFAIFKSRISVFLMNMGFPPFLLITCLLTDAVYFVPRFPTPAVTHYADTQSASVSYFLRSYSIWIKVILNIFNRQWTSLRKIFWPNGDSKILLENLTVS